MIDFADRTSDESPSERRDRLLALSPSAKLVFKVLELDAPQTPSQIAEQSRLPARTVRHALSALEEQGLVEQRISFRDARKRLYEPYPVAEAELE